MLLLAWHSISYHYCIPFWHLRSELESTMLSISILADLSNGGEPATRIPASSSGCWWRNRHKESRMSWGGFFSWQFLSNCAFSVLLVSTKLSSCFRVPPGAYAFRSSVNGASALAKSTCYGRFSTSALSMSWPLLLVRWSSLIEWTWSSGADVVFIFRSVYPDLWIYIDQDPAGLVPGRTL